MTVKIPRKTETNACFIGSGFGIWDSCVCNVKGCAKQHFAKNIMAAAQVTLVHLRIFFDANQGGSLIDFAFIMYMTSFYMLTSEQLLQYFRKKV